MADRVFELLCVVHKEIKAQQFRWNITKHSLVYIVRVMDLLLRWFPGYPIL